MTKPTFPRAQIEIAQIHSNLRQEIIQITGDKLRLILRDYKSGLEKQLSWKGDLGIVISLVLAIVASDFKTVWGIESSVWRSIFVLGAIIYAAKLFVSLIKYFKSPGIEAILEKIKSTDC